MGLEHSARGATRNGSRDRILRVSAELFREHGYAATSIQDIAQRLGRVKSSLYHHFSSKEQILAEILDRGLNDVLGPLEEILASQLRPLEKLRAGILHELRSVTQGIDAPAAAVALQEPGALPPDVRDRFLARRDRVDKIFRAIVTEGINAGVFRPVDEKMFTFAVLGMCNWALQWYSSRGALSCDQIAEAFFDYALRGLQTPVNSPAPQHP